MKDGGQERVQFRRRLCLQPPHGVHLRLHVIEVGNNASLLTEGWSGHFYTFQKTASQPWEHEIVGEDFRLLDK